MSDHAEEAAPKKKKGKLPIIIVLALVLGGGGFFMMKGKEKPKHKKKPVSSIKIADKETEMEEFLTNTANPSVYVRVKLSIKLWVPPADDPDAISEAKFTANIGDVRDAVISVFNGTQPSDITNASKRRELKHILAEAMNEALAGAVVKKDEEEGEGEGHAPKTPERAGKVTEAPTAVPDWDSPTGPVLKVSFVNLATQSI